jgi:hypothetical protein
MKYVVAAPWSDRYKDAEGLCIYTFGQEIQEGEDGQWLVDRAKQQSPDFNWAVYEVELTKL